MSVQFAPCREPDLNSIPEQLVVIVVDDDSDKYGDSDRWSSFSTSQERVCHRESAGEIPVELVAQLAYNRFLARGAAPGFDAEDWFAAIEQIKQKLASLPLVPDANVDKPTLQHNVLNEDGSDATSAPRALTDSDEFGNIWLVERPSRSAITEEEIARLLPGCSVLAIHAHTDEVYAGGTPSSLQAGCRLRQLNLSLFHLEPVLPGIGSPKWDNL